MKKGKSLCMLAAIAAPARNLHILLEYHRMKVMEFIAVLARIDKVLRLNLWS